MLVSSRSSLRKFVGSENSETKRKDVVRRTGVKAKNSEEKKRELQYRVLHTLNDGMTMFLYMLLSYLWTTGSNCNDGRNE